jgi:hypothetical protein
VGRTFTWTVEFDVDEDFVADGFNPNDEKFLHIFEQHFYGASAGELAARIVKRPLIEKILQVQGYDAAEILKMKERARLGNND